MNLLLKILSEAAEILIEAEPDLDSDSSNVVKNGYLLRYQDDAEKWGIQELEVVGKLLPTLCLKMALSKKKLMHERHLQMSLFREVNGFSQVGDLLLRSSSLF